MTVDLQLKIRRRGSAAGQMKKSASWREEMHLYDTTAPGYKNRGSPVASQPGGGGGGGVCTWMGGTLYIKDIHKHPPLWTLSA